MGVKNIEIIFDSNPAVFTPGQTVTGRVLIAVHYSVKIRSVILKFRGEAKVLWTELKKKTSINNRMANNSTQSNFNTVEYYAREKYFKNKIPLVGSELHLEEGEHDYPFNFSLPRQLPSTFKGTQGYVRYVAHVKIDIPWAIDKRKETEFHVISPINLNDEPSLAEPKKLDVENYYSFWCCKSGPTTLVVSVPYTGFVPGQNIPLTIELDNNSDVAFDAVKVMLGTVTTFKSTSPRTKIKSSLREITLLHLQGVAAHSSKTWTEQITFPNGSMIPNLKFCEIITNKHSLKVIATAVGMHTNPVVNMQIKMGNIPLTIMNQYAPRFGFSNQQFESDSNILSAGQYPINATRPTGFFETSSGPGFAYQVSPYDPPPSYDHSYY